MNKIIAALLFFSAQLFQAQSLDLSNQESPTHLGSIDGPLAGPNIYAEFFVGDTANNLTPVLPAVAHEGNPDRGFVIGPSYTVPGHSGHEIGVMVYVQMGVWDSTYWGKTFSSVPNAQVGFTDIVPVELNYIGSTRPLNYPIFNTWPVVPAIPEPNIIGLLAIGGLVLAWVRNFYR